MSTDFFKKKKIWIPIIFGVIIFAMLVLFAISPLFQVKKIYVGYKFHYLIIPTENVEVGVFNAQLDGGAGYTLNVNGKARVALSVYTDEQDGQNVCASLQSTGEQCELITLGVDALYLKSRAEKRNERELVGAFQTFYNCLTILEQEIFRLDKGATQESSKRILSKLKAQLTFLGKQYSSSFAKYAALCAEMAGRISEILKKEIYAKDLRGVLCEASYEFVAIGAEFSL